MRTTWNTKDGRRLAITAMSDEHLVAALRMGLRAESKRMREAALDRLDAAYQAGNGAEEIGGLEYDDALSQSFSVSALKARLAATVRYAPVVAEVEKRGLRLLRRRTARGH